MPGSQAKACRLAIRGAGVLELWGTGAAGQAFRNTKLLSGVGFIAGLWTLNLILQEIYCQVLSGFGQLMQIRFLETYFIPGTVLDSENVSMNKRHNVHKLVGLTFGGMGWE